MARVEALGISGIRSYSPDRLEKIHFLTPLTLIYGKNGSGKSVFVYATQTIIECLKFVTTGAYPPFSDRGKNFITDPKLAGTPEVKGDIRLRFRTVNNKEVIAKKMIAISKTVKGLSLRAVEQSLKTRDAKLGEVEVSQRCSDIQKQTPLLLGMSQSILQNIVFCLQDESLWPFSDNSTLKGIFDELFETKRFIKVTQTMKESIKNFQSELRIQKGKLNYLKTYFEKTVESKTERLKTLSQAWQDSVYFCKLKQQLEQINKQKLVSEEEEKIDQKLEKKVQLEYKIKSARQKISYVQQNAKKVLTQKFDVEKQTKFLNQIKNEVEKSKEELKLLQKKIEASKNIQKSSISRVQFQAELRRIKDFIPEIKDKLEGEISQVMKLVDQKYSEVAETEKKYKQLIKKYNAITIPEIESQDSSMENAMNEKISKREQEKNQLEKQLKAQYHGLYRQIRKEYKNVEIDREAKNKLQILRGQIEMKKNELKHYTSMPPKQKSKQQKIRQIQYAGIQLQQKCLKYLEMKHSCVMCNRLLSSQQSVVMKKMIEKTKEKARKKIQTIKEQKTSGNSFDPEPMIKQIESFLQKADEMEKKLEVEVEKKSKYESVYEQNKINHELNAAFIELKLSPNHSFQYSQSMKEVSLDRFKQLLYQYKVKIMELKNLRNEVICSKQKRQRIQNLAASRSQEKKKIYSQILQIETVATSARVIEGIYEKMKQLYPYIRQEQASARHPEVDTKQPVERIKYLTKLISEKQNEQSQIKDAIAFVELSNLIEETQKELCVINKILEESKLAREERKKIIDKSNSIKLEMSGLQQKILINKESATTPLNQTQTEYLQVLMRVKHLTQMIGDVEKAVRAMEKTTNKVHNDKLDEINKILCDMWNEVYHGEDIQYIKINAIAEKKNGGYTYSILMCKNGELVDMKGKCSMGQKVLASLIIRMALAEIFSNSTRILALDEPTTNLDRGHIANLATSIARILEVSNGFLQIIIITHDREFLNILKKYTQNYYEVSRDTSNFSVILKKEIAQLEKQS